MKLLIQTCNRQLRNTLLTFVVCGLLGPITNAQELPDFAELVEINAPTIVEIATSRQVESRSPVEDRELDELLRRLNPGQAPELNPENIPELRQRGAVGSGFIISADGYIITNNHVVAAADEIRVTLNDRRVFDAEIIGLDEPSDLALLKIGANNLPRVKFGDSDRLRVGEWVLAIGSPFGLEFSAAAGIVSAKGRSMPGRSTYNYMSFIQTDVAINQGNSGGRLSTNAVRPSLVSSDPKRFANAKPSILYFYLMFYAYLIIHLLSLLLAYWFLQSLNYRYFAQK